MGHSALGRLSHIPHAALAAQGAPEHPGKAADIAERNCEIGFRSAYKLRPLGLSMNRNGKTGSSAPLAAASVTTVIPIKSTRDRALSERPCVTGVVQVPIPPISGPNTCA